MVIIHLRRNRSAASPANGTQMPYTNMKTVPIQPICSFENPRLDWMKLFVPL